MTEADHAVQDEVARFHLGQDKPVVRHLIAPPRDVLAREAAIRET